MSRPSWMEHFFEIAQLAAKRSTCISRQVGAVAVMDRRVLCTGYNGAPKGVAHCSELKSCMRKELNIPSGQRHEICRAVHAEQNIIIQAATFGITLAGADIYCTHSPCSLCAKMLLNLGVRNFYYLEGYPDELAIDMIGESGTLNLQKVKL